MPVLPPHAELLLAPEGVTAAVTRVADAVSTALADQSVRPLALVVMRGGLIFAGHLLPQIHIPVDVDDILDEGLTLAAIREKLLEAGAAKVLIAVFADKDLQRVKPVKADFVGVTLPNRYVFGFGMDVRGQWRNLPAVYALAQDQQD